MRRGIDPFLAYVGMALVAVAFPGAGISVGQAAQRTPPVKDTFEPKHIEAEAQHETRTWQAIALPWIAGEASNARIDIVDTEGVCLYVARGHDGQSIAAVPKSQLRAGEGCQ